VLNANYLMARLRELDEHIPPAFDRLCMHEFVLSGAPMRRELGIKTLDLAKEVRVGIREGKEVKDVAGGLKSDVVTGLDDGGGHRGSGPEGREGDRERGRGARTCSETVPHGGRSPFLRPRRAGEPLRRTAFDDTVRVQEWVHLDAFARRPRRPMPDVHLSVACPFSG
jgi:hypothetical protein